MPLTAAERQRKRREKLRESGLYEQYKVKHRYHSKQCRKRKRSNLDKMTNENKNRVLDEKRAADRERQRRWRLKQKQGTFDSVARMPGTSPRAYSASSSLNRATNRLKKVLPKSPRKRKAILRNLVLEFGDGDQQRPKRTRISTIGSETVSKVKQFYCRDDISRIAPGRRDVITVRESGIKAKLQKRHLFMSIKECYSSFKEENPNIKIGVSKFAELRPQNVLLSSATPSNVCLCVYHQNFILALDAIHNYISDIPAYNKDFLSTCLVSSEEASCWFSECHHQNCGFNSTYSRFMLSLGVADDDEGDGTETLQVKWMKWEEVSGRLVKCEKTGTVWELYNHIDSMAPKFLRHCFVKRKQAERYELDKAMALKTDSTIAVLQMDFAENFTCVAQDEVQSAHWNQAQVTLFTSVAWFQGNVLPHVVVSNYMRHEKTSAIVFMDQILSGMPEGITEVRVWTDGPASQFKNKYVMSAILPLSQKHGLQINWNFSATSHGKGPVDGVGAALKRCAANAITTRTATINSAEDFYNTVKQSTSIQTSLVPAIILQERAEQLKLDAVFEAAKPIKGIANFHFVAPTSNGYVTRRYTDEASSPSSDNPIEEHEEESDSLSISDEDIEYDGIPKVDQFVAVKIKGKRADVVYVYMAQILQVDDNEVKLRYLCKSGNLYHWLSDLDDTWQPVLDIICEIPSPVLVNNRGQLSFQGNTIEKIEHSVLRLPEVIQTVYFK